MALREKLVKLYREQLWKGLSYSDLDTGFSELTEQEKTTIIESFKNDDDRAKRLIKTKLVDGLQAYAEQMADAAIESGVVPIDLISDKLG